MVTLTRKSIWKVRVNAFLGSIFLGTCALWAALIMIQASWGINPVANAFASVVEAETQLPAEIP